MEWGPHEAELERYRRAGIRVAALESKPDLYDDLRPLWQAFWQLSRCRPSGWGPSAIPVSEIVAYLDLRHITDPDTRVEWADLIAVMDNEWLRWAVDQQKEAKADHAKNRTHH